MQIRHPWRWAASLAIAVLVALTAYAGWLLWDTSRQLSAAADDAQQAKNAVLSGDGDGTEAALSAFTGHAATAADRTDSPVWSLMTHLPAVGDDARGVRTVSRVADSLARDGLSDLTSTIGDLDQVLPRNGSVDVESVRSLQEPVARGNAALAQARSDLDAEDPSGYVGALQTRYVDLQSQVDEAADAMSVANRSLAVLPEMLGADGSRNYLLVLQNNAEIRSTGGLPGSVSLLNVDDGAINLAKQRAGSSFGEAPEPVLPLTDAERTLFGDNLGRYFLDANLTPDFARSSALWQARWQQVEGDPVDGVISLDTVTLSYLLRALGPVEVDGVQLTPDNVVDELLSKVYARLPDPAAQDVFFRDVAATVFGRVTSFGGSTQELLSALRQSADEHRLLIHDFDDDIQAQLAGSTVAGELTADRPSDPQVGIYFNDGTLSKMSYYLRYDTQVMATSCRDGVQGLTGRLTVRSTAPADAATSLPAYVTGTGLPRRSAGSQLVVVQIFGPLGGTVDEFDDNQLDFEQFETDLDGRQVRTTYLLLKPGETQDLTWTMQSGPEQDGGTRVSVTPPIEPGSSSRMLRSAC